MVEQWHEEKRQVEIKKGLHVTFEYPIDYTTDKGCVPVLVDFKELAALASNNLPKMPSGLGRLWSESVSNDRIYLDELEKYDRINNGIYHRGRIEMPLIIYNNDEQKFMLYNGRHRMRALEAAGAEKIFVLINESNAAKLESAAGVSRTKPAQEQSTPTPLPKDADTPWSDQFRQNRSTSTVQKNAGEAPKFK